MSGCRAAGGLLYKLDIFMEAGPLDGKPGTNHLSYGTA
jgi:hypothetical protein